MQTPKEKAYQLVKEFYVETTTSTEAKQCAKLHISLILENEIIKPHNRTNILFIVTPLGLMIVDWLFVSSH